MSVDAIAIAAGSQASRDRKVTLRIVPILFASYVAACLDRVNVGLAKLQMLRDPLAEERTATIAHYKDVANLAADLRADRVLYIAGWRVFGTERAQA